MENNQLPNNENNVQPVAPVQPVAEQQQAVQPVTEQQEVKPAEENVEQKENKNEKQVVDTSFKNPDAFNSKEKVLFEVEPEKESNPVGTAIIFAILIFGLFMLPFAEKLFNKPNQNPDIPRPAAPCSRSAASWPHGAARPRPEEDRSFGCCSPFWGL